jgi:hypothetical protein
MALVILMPFAWLSISSVSPAPTSWPRTSTGGLLTSRRHKASSHPRRVHLQRQDIPEAIAEFSRTHSSDFGLIAAVLPVILTLVFQRYMED